MAEQTQGIANKKLLIVAVVLAAIVVVFYNLQISRIRKASKGDTEWILRYTVDRQVGDTLSASDIEAVELDTSFVKGLGRCLTRKERDFAIGRRLNQSVTMRQWVLWSHVTAKEQDNPSAKIKLRMRKYSFPIDPDQSPVENLRDGDRVNVWGMFAVGKKEPKAFLIIENIKVMEVPSRRKITVEVTPEIAGQLANIRTNALGRLWVTVRNPTERGNPSEIHPNLRDMAASPDAMSAGDFD